MHEEQSRLTRLMVTAALVISCPVVSAQAQEVAQNDEIVVTAQRREQSLQTVPVSVQAFSAETLSTMGQTNLLDLTTSVTNASFDQNAPLAGSSQIISAYIRGIGQDDYAFQFEPGVGIYVDGVYFARTIGAAVDLLDVERVEVLKGPQGTLFGRNATGGAISVVTRRPSQEFHTDFEFSTGSFDRTSVRGAVDVPLFDGAVLSQLSFSVNRRDGNFNRLQYPGNYVTDREFLVGPGRVDFSGPVTPISSPNTAGGSDAQNLRLKLEFEPSDNLTVSLSADYIHSEEEAIGRTLLDTTLGAGEPGETGFTALYNLCISTPAAALAGIAPAGVPLSDGAAGGLCGARTNNPAPLAGVNVDADPFNDRLTYGDQFITGDPDSSYATGYNFSRLSGWGVSSTVNWGLAEDVNLTSITAYRTFDAQNGLDGDGSPVEVLDLAYDWQHEQVSQELQLAGTAFDDSLDWLVGLYYFNEKGVATDYINVFGGLLAQITNPVDIDYRSVAAFTHGTLHLNDALSITGGVRFTQEEKELQFAQRDLNRLAAKFAGIPDVAYPEPSDLTLLNPLDPLNRDFENVSYRIGPELQVSPNVFLYASFSTGFKSGGWNTRPLFPVDFASLLAAGELEFDEEEAQQWEVGGKFDLFNRRLRANIAAFTTDYSNIQVLSFNAAGSPFIANAGDARIRGAELDLQAVLGDGLRLNAGVGYLDAEYTRIAPGASVTLDSGLNNVPEWSISLGLDYEQELSSAGRILYHLDYSSKSEMYNSSDNNPLLVDDLEALGASIGYESPDGQWQLVLRGTNITDDRSIINGYSAPGLGVVEASYTRPAEWLLSLRIRN